MLRKSTPVATSQLVPSPSDILSIQDGQFGWGSGSEPEKSVLTNVNISIKEGSVVVVVGPVASGKSTSTQSHAG